MIVIVKKHRHFHTAQPPHNASREIISILRKAVKVEKNKTIHFKHWKITYFKKCGDL